MSWNYRVIRHIDAEGNESYMVHEVYYTPEGRPQMYTVNGVAPYGESLDELRKDVERFAAAVEKPVLTSADFPPENDVA